ncbi:MAG: class II aldolase/adducin family protein [Alphaproteobacteria bacterium]|nr:class II aldolase/adducin family protein [Alphaproteobacteria bacterium]
MADLETTIRDLAIANRILAREGVVDAYGHVAVRHPDRPDRYLLARSRSPERVTRADVLEYTLASEAIVKPTPKPYTERFIHGGVFEARPDLAACVHNHAYTVLPFTVSKTPLRPIWHTASGMGHLAPVWDIREKFGDTNLLVVNVDHGRDLARALGNNIVALMRGHGCIVVGRTLQAAVITAINTMLNAQMLLAALQLGPVTYLSPGEVEKGLEMYYSPIMSTERAWEYYSSRCDLSDI